MSTAGDRPIVINILKPWKLDTKSDFQNKKVPPKSIFKKIARKSSAKSVQFGITHSKPIQADSLKEDSILSYRLFTKKQEELRRKHNLSIDLVNKYKIIYTDLRNRLYVEDPPDEVRAVTDFDEGFFKTLVERPYSKYVPLYKSLKHLYSQSVRMRQDIGYRHDAVLNIAATHRRELKRYDESFQLYKDQVKYFDRFVAEDYKKSMAYLEKCDKVEKEVRLKIFELENSAMDKFTIISRLIGLDYSYGLQQKYGRFLYYLSPPSWRAKHREFAQSVEIEAKGFDFGASSEEDTFNVIFERMQKECFSGLVKPPLYFTDPQDLLDIFNAIEKQQLHHFSYLTYLAPHALMLNKGISALKQNITNESAVVRHMVKRFKRYLEFYEKRETQLQAKFLKILNGVFYESVGAPEVLKLGLHLEFCYEKVHHDKPNFMDIATLAKAIESYYLHYCYKFDSLHNDEIKLAMKKCLEDEKRKMKKAKIASMELRLFRRLERELLRAYEPPKSSQVVPLPPIKRKTRISKTKTDKRKLPQPKPKQSGQYEPTEAEVEYLLLFTDWTEADNPADYLQSAHFSSPRNNEADK